MGLIIKKTLDGKYCSEKGPKFHLGVGAITNAFRQTTVCHFWCQVEHIGCREKKKWVSGNPKGAINFIHVVNNGLGPQINKIVLNSQASVNLTSKVNVKS